MYLIVSIFNKSDRARPPVIKFFFNSKYVKYL